MKTFRSFITEESLLDAHMKYREAGIPLPDRDDITEYPGGKHGYPTGSDTFAVHSISPSVQYPNNIAHFKSTPNGDLWHNSNGPAVTSITMKDGQPVKTVHSYFVDGKHIMHQLAEDK